jgi:hypothetical protein
VSTPAIPLVNFPAGETVTIKHLGVTGQDAYGVDIYGVTSQDDVVAAVAPRVLNWPPRVTRPGGFAEDLEGAYEVAYGYQIFLPAGTAIALTDHVVVRGEEMQIDVIPAVWTSPLTGAGAVQVNVSRIDG